MWHHVERIQETAVVQNPPVHIVCHRVILVPTERQGHGGTGTPRGTGRWRRKRKRGGGGEDHRQEETQTDL